MISWRYHLVSIVAVFLALGLGILVGTTVLNDSLVDGLRGRTEKLQTLNSDLRNQLDDALQRVASDERFATDVQPIVVSNRLAAQQVVIVTSEGADADALDEATRVLDLAGARVVASITVQASMTSTVASDAQELAGIVGAPPDLAGEDLMAAAADALAARLSAAPLRPVDANDDLLADLLNGGLVVAPGLSDAGLADIGGPGQVVVVIGGGADDPASTAGELLLAPLVAGLVERGHMTVAGEGSDPTSTFVSSARDLTGSAALVSIDGLDDVIGGSALVLGIDRAVLTGQGGAFGLGEQASQPLPDPTA